MAQTQNYEVYYDIKVNATEGTEQVTAFANAVEKLSKGRISFAPVVTNINEMMQAVEKTFRGKNGKKKDFNFDLEIRTGETEKRLEGVKNLLTEIKELTQGIKLTINPGEKIDGRALRNQTNKLVGKKKLDEQQAEAKRNAASAVKSVMDTQRTVTRSIGKINSALAHLEKRREVNIKTDAARARLQEILILLGNIRGAATMTLHLNTAAPATSVPAVCPSRSRRSFRQGTGRTEQTSLCGRGHEPSAHAAGQRESGLASGDLPADVGDPCRRACRTLT